MSWSDQVFANSSAGGCSVLGAGEAVGASAGIQAAPRRSEQKIGWICGYGRGFPENG